MNLKRKQAGHAFKRLAEAQALFKMRRDPRVTKSGVWLRRWSLDHRGYLLSQVVTARDELDAMAQLLERRPDLKGSYLLPQDAR